MRKPPHLVKTRHYLLLLGSEDEIGQDQVSLENCGIVAEDAATDQDVMRGAAMDDPLNGFEPTVSLQGFARHRPEPWDH
jgi:hypothetical protein